MKRILSIIILALALGAGFYYYQNGELPTVEDAKQMVMESPALKSVGVVRPSSIEEWTAYCEERGGQIMEEERDDGTMTICFVNDGLDGIRCQAELFYNQECGYSENAQQAFLDVRGNPDVYMILFSDARFDETGRVVVRAQPTRIETWTFDAPDNVVASFENGYYLSEEPTGLTIDVQDHDISPLEFDFNTSKSDIRRLMGGNPDCSTEADGGPHQIEVMKYESTYDRPGGTFSFSDNQIMAVTMGVGYSEFPDKLCE